MWTSLRWTDPIFKYKVLTFASGVIRDNVIKIVCMLMYFAKELCIKSPLFDGRILSESIKIFNSTEIESALCSRI